MAQKPISHQWLIIISFAAVYIIWGTTYLAIVIGLQDFPPFIMGGIRFTMAATLLLGWSYLRGERLTSSKTIINNVIIGIFVLAGGQGILFWTEQHISTGYAAVFGASLPIWFVLIDRQQWSVSFSNKYIIFGLLLGLGGILLLFKEQLEIADMAPSGSTYMGVVASIALIFASICWVAGSLYYRSYPAPGSMIFNVGWQLASGAIFCFLVGGLNGELNHFSIAQVQADAWLAVVYLAIAGSIIAFIAYHWLLTQKPSSVVGTYAYINPVIAVLLGWIVANEVISTYQISGMILILISAMLINFSRAGKLKGSLNES